MGYGYTDLYNYRTKKKIYIFRVKCQKKNYD